VRLLQRDSTMTEPQGFSLGAVLRNDLYTIFLTLGACMGSILFGWHVGMDSHHVWWRLQSWSMFIHRRVILAVVWTARTLVLQSTHRQ